MTDTTINIDVLIAGAGHAGAQAALMLRKLGYAGAVALAGATTAAIAQRSKNSPLAPPSSGARTLRAAGLGRQLSFAATRVARGAGRLRASSLSEMKLVNVARARPDEASRAAQHAVGDAWSRAMRGAFRSMCREMTRAARNARRPGKSGCPGGPADAARARGRR